MNLIISHSPLLLNRVKFFKPLKPTCVYFHPGPLPSPLSSLSLRWSDLQGVRTVCRTISLSSHSSTCVKRPSHCVKANKHGRADCVSRSKNRCGFYPVMKERGGTVSQMEKLISTQTFTAVSLLPPLPSHPYSWISYTCGVSFQCYTHRTDPLSASKSSSNRKNVCWISQWGEFGLYKSGWCCLSDLGCSCSHLEEQRRVQRRCCG